MRLREPEGDGVASTHVLKWLGQAGFLIYGENLVVALDPYLSDRCEEIYGLRRIQQSPLGLDDLRVDLLLVSHWHEDHFDLPAVAAAIARGSAVIAPPSVNARLHSVGLADRSVDAIPGQTIQHGRARVTPIPALHRVPGFLTEDAVGFRLDLGGISYYHSGDTEYTREIVTALRGHRIDVAMVCINGTGGNMNATEAAALCAQLDPRVIVPMHFGMWHADGYGEGATLDPEQFVRLCTSLDPSARFEIPVAASPINLPSPGRTA